MKSFNKLWLFIFIWIAGLYPLYLYSNFIMEEKIRLITEQRVNYVRQQLEIGFSYLRSQKQQIETNIALARKKMLFHPAVNQLKNFTKINAYGLTGEEIFKDNLDLDLNITGIGKLSNIPPNVKDEIHAAMSLNLYSAVKDSNYDFVWSYYTSKNNFMALSPKVSISDFHFNKDIYNKPFWYIATPQNNPQARIVISPLYIDAAGMGKMISISNPVYENNQFIGVISLDLGLKKLQEGLSIGIEDIPGTSYLLSDKGQLLASSNDSKNAFDLNNVTSLFSKRRQGQFRKIGHDIFYIQTVIKSELYIVQEISEGLFLKSLSTHMLYFMIIYLFITIIIYLVFHLYYLLKKVKCLASIDDLTKLYNRRAFFSLASKSMSISIRNNRPISVIILDVDLFKKVNDQYGHSIGDKALNFLSKTITESVRESDIVCRYGGEEFVILLPESHLQGAFSIAEKIRNKLLNSTFSKHAITISISAGCAECHLPKETLEAMIERADQALYQAKQEGRNKVIMA